MLDNTEPKPGNINSMWEQTNAVYVKTSKAYLGHKNRARKDWISEDTWQTIGHRQAPKESIQ